MGQENQKATSAPLDDILGREMEIYRWRSDPNFNEYVARVTFKSAFAQHQEDLYAEFLKLQETKEYLEIYKFREQLQRIPDTKDEQVVIFETYDCSLSDLQKQLSFEECLYLFYGLLTGYEQIKKIFEKIVIDSSCCFVTKEGAVRAWINPNPRSNQQWLGVFRELKVESSQTEVVLKIIKMAEATLRISKRGQLFFTQLSSLFKTPTFKNCSFSLLRRWINQYCYMHRIQMAKKINMETRYKSRLPSNLRESKLSVREERKTEFKEYRFRNKENIAFLQTRYSEADQNLDQKVMLTKSKSVDKNHFGWGSTVINDFIPDQTSPSIRRESMGATLNHCNSLVFVHKNSQKCSTMMDRPQKEDPKLSQIKESTFICSQIQKNSDIFKHKANDVPYVKNSMTQLEKKSKVSVSHKMSEKEVQVSLHPSEEKMGSIMKNHVQRAPKSTMQVSIINGIPEDQKEESSFKHKSSKYRTVYSPKQSIECINESDIFSRPWITTKTITKLVSENQNGSSLQNSIAESSEYYNTSNYSGALTQMGRDITLKEDTGNGRSRTVRVSRQV